MQRLTPKGIKNYLTTNYGGCRHNSEAMAIACRKTAKNKPYSPKDVFHLVVENEPIVGQYTHSYGFHTANGRAIIETFESEYYEACN